MHLSRCTEHAFSAAHLVSGNMVILLMIRFQCHSDLAGLHMGRPLHIHGSLSGKAAEFTPFGLLWGDVERCNRIPVTYLSLPDVTACELPCERMLFRLT